ncbi:MAG: carbohydrate kinase family protein [bacterium]|nr:carbohydrate kinase family protein [bacterium]
MDNQLDFLAIGDIVTDAFIKLSEAEVKDCVNHERQELCISFGDKVPFDSVTIVKGVGNCANAAVSASRLGLKAGLVTYVGNDQYGKECIETMQADNVNTDYIEMQEGKKTNYHYVLWYGVERTILVNHEHYTYTWPNVMPAPKWIYLTSLGAGTEEYHNQISQYLIANPEVKLAFQPGTFQIKMGTEALKDIYAHTEVFFCNVEEAKRILNSEESDIKVLMAKLKELGPKHVVITDGINGAYAFDGNESWFMPIYPHDPFERTGAGDAFASTLTSALALGMPLGEAIKWGPVNSMSVVQKIGAQEGLLPREKLEEYLKNAPQDYQPKKI